MTEPPSHDRNAEAETKSRARRDHRRPIKVLVTGDERADLEARAASTGMAVSSYLRAVGLGQPITNVYDHAAVRDLIKVSGDLGRFGGLLKLWLSEQRGKGASAIDVNRLLAETRAIQGDIRQRLASI